MSRGSKSFSGLLRLEQIVVVETVVVGHSAAVHVEPPLQLSCNDKESLILIILIIKLLDSIFHPGHMGRLKNGLIIDKARGHGILPFSARITPIPKLQSKYLRR